MLVLTRIDGTTDCSADLQLRPDSDQLDTNGPEYYTICFNSAVTWPGALDPEPGLPRGASLPYVTFFNQYWIFNMCFILKPLV